MPQRTQEDLGARVLTGSFALVTGVVVAAGLAVWAAADIDAAPDAPLVLLLAGILLGVALSAAAGNWIVVGSGRSAAFLHTLLGVWLGIQVVLFVGALVIGQALVPFFGILWFALLRARIGRWRKRVREGRTRAGV